MRLFFNSFARVSLSQVLSWSNSLPPPCISTSLREFLNRSHRHDHYPIARAALIVFFIKSAIVIGPTPPGTGVIAPAFSETSS